LLKYVGDLSNLGRAARLVLSKARVSADSAVREEAQDFEKNLVSNLFRLKWRLDRGRHKFQPSRGFVKKKASGAKRPVVVSRIEDRVVRRALLNALQRHPAVAAALDSPTSFGGIESRGVREAIAAAVAAIRSGRTYFIRADIKDFFRHLPRNKVLNELLGAVSDPLLLDLATKAGETELENLAALREDASLFPLHDEGVAQGSCLSPLLANCALRTFDEQLNGRGIVTLRYLDDFLILGAQPRSVRRAFAKAQALLSALSPTLQAYDPKEASRKAEEGHVASGIHFLGCEIYPDRVRPGASSRTRFLAHIDEIISACRLALRRPSSMRRREHTLLRSLQHVSNVVEGWNKQFAYCTDHRLMQAVQLEVDNRLAAFLKDELEQVRGRLAAGAVESALDRLGIYRWQPPPPGC